MEKKKLWLLNLGWWNERFIKNCMSNKENMSKCDVLVTKKLRKPIPFGEEYGSLTIIGYFGHRGKDKYRCLRGGQKTCGECPIAIGAKHYAWKGCGEISRNLWSVYRNGAKARNLEFKLTVEDMWNLFVKQDGKCAFTGFELYFNKTYRNQKERTASLDRIDSTKGYICGNVQWVHRDINYLKNNMQNKKFIDICIAVAINQQKKIQKDGFSTENFDHD